MFLGKRGRLVEEEPSQGCGSIEGGEEVEDTVNGGVSR